MTVKKEIDINSSADNVQSDIFWDTMYAHLCRYQCGHITIVELFHEWKRLLGLGSDGTVAQLEVEQEKL